MQYTLYIRKDIDERFKDEDEKSKLVNTLLDRHYSGVIPQPSVVREPRKPLMVENWGNLDDFAKQKGLDEATKHQSIEQQLEALGLKYDKYRPNEAFNPDIEDYVPYQTKDGEVILD